MTLNGQSVGIWRVQEKHSYVLASFDLDQWPLLVSAQHREYEAARRTGPR